MIQTGSLPIDLTGDAFKAAKIPAPYGEQDGTVVVSFPVAFRPPFDLLPAVLLSVTAFRHAGLHEHQSISYKVDPLRIRRDGFDIGLTIPNVTWIEYLEVSWLAVTV